MFLLKRQLCGVDVGCLKPRSFVIGHKLASLQTKIKWLSIGRDSIVILFGTRSFIDMKFLYLLALNSVGKNLALAAVLFALTGLVLALKL